MTQGVQSLLRDYARILDELNRLKVIRTRNAPAADVAESLVAAAYHGQLAPSSTKGHDVEAGGRLIQVKCRVLSDDHKSGQFSAFRSFGFDAGVFVVFNRDYSVGRAVEVARSDVEAAGVAVEWVRGHRVMVTPVLNGRIPGLDVTEKVAGAWSALEPEAKGDSLSVDVKPTGVCFCGCGGLASHGK